jgi:BirA family transcriptional regulator, biotin operon repressor / biotin---[acetyl-CoA-carboxylase] ligase
LYAQGIAGTSRKSASIEFCIKKRIKYRPMHDYLTKDFAAVAIHCLDQTTSTMEEARNLSRNQSCGAVMAEAQTAGRGRVPGRTWNTQPGQALLSTIWFPRTGQEFPVSLLAGLAVARACLAWAGSVASPFSNGLAIKWPNDLLCGGRKLAGILCESSTTSIYVGIGINCSQDSFTGEYRTRPTSILLETGRTPDRHLLLTMILDELQLLIRRPTGWTVELGHLLAWKGKAVDFRQGLAGGQPIRGILAGIAEDGGRIRKTCDGNLCFHSGELSPVIDADT